MKDLKTMNKTFYALLAAAILATSCNLRNTVYVPREKDMVGTKVNSVLLVETYNPILDKVNEQLVVEKKDGTTLTYESMNDNFGSLERVPVLKYLTVKNGVGTQTTEFDLTELPRNRVSYVLIDSSFRGYRSLMDSVIKARDSADRVKTKSYLAEQEIVKTAQKRLYQQQQKQNLEKMLY
jgi:hypothetical protein